MITKRIFFLLLMVACLSKAVSQALTTGVYFHGAPLNENYSAFGSDTTGSRLLLKEWVKGTIVNATGGTIYDTALSLNYDKLNHELIVTRDFKTYLHADRGDVKSFTLFTPGRHLIFNVIPEIGTSFFVQLLSAGNTCTVYKRINLEIKRPTYVTDGKVETGNPNYEYVDKVSYYIMNVSGKNKFSAKFYPTKPSIKQAFGFDQDKLDKYFTLHPKDEPDDGFVKGIADFYNQ